MTWVPEEPMSMPTLVSVTLTCCQIGFCFERAVFVELEMVVVVVRPYSSCCVHEVLARGDGRPCCARRVACRLSSYPRLQPSKIRTIELTAQRPTAVPTGVAKFVMPCAKARSEGRKLNMALRAEQGPGVLLAWASPRKATSSVLYKGSHAATMPSPQRFSTQAGSFPLETGLRADFSLAEGFVAHLSF